MPASVRHRHPALRLITLLLLLAAAACFGVSMVRISFSPSFIAALQQLPGLGALPTACVNGGIAAYSGLTLATGGDPTVNAACLSHIRDAGQANLGVQPLTLLAGLAIVGAVALIVWGPRGHRLLSGALSLVAGTLLVLNALQLGQVFAGHFGRGASAITSGPDLGLWVVLGLLVLVPLVQLVAAGVGWVRLALAPIEEGSPARH
ncbi:MAG: hypothetical protein ABSC16_05715 [Candidatus Dormibacteria bacterium]|jgi:hypothetical protein|nr:hypothetical protein [Chloroflexota bacterium]HBV95365.1 hypothetical protein [Chloroflexota bacterium]